MLMISKEGDYMSDYGDDYFHGNDDEYWDDIYFEKHRGEYSSGSSSSGGGIWLTILIIFFVVGPIASISEPLGMFALVVVIFVAIYISAVNREEESKRIDAIMSRNKKEVGQATKQDGNISRPNRGPISREQFEKDRERSRQIIAELEQLEKERVRKQNENNE
ncbi:MAG: hypothetical protein KBS96_01255 [Lachnospiraceae bacterium]|nr:hypothetical protein [Candidatus Colinaster scatohippi]